MPIANPHLVSEQVVDVIYDAQSVPTQAYAEQVEEVSARLQMQPQVAIAQPPPLLYAPAEPVFAQSGTLTADGQYRATSAPRIVDGQIQDGPPPSGGLFVPRLERAPPPPRSAACVAS